VSDDRLFLQRFNGFSFDNILLPNLEEQIVRVNGLRLMKDGNFYVRAGTASGHIFLLFNPFTTQFTEIKFLGVGNKSETYSNVFTHQEREYIFGQKDHEITLFTNTGKAQFEPVISFSSEEKDFSLDDSTQFIPFEDFFLISDDDFSTLAYDWNGKPLDFQLPQGTGSPTTKEKINVAIKQTFQRDGIVYAYLGGYPELHVIDEKEMKIVSMNLPNSRMERGHLALHTDTYGTSLLVSSKEKETEFRIFKEGVFEPILSQLDITSSSRMSVASQNINKGMWLATNKQDLHYFEFPSDDIKTYLPGESIRSIADLDSENYVVASETSGWFRLNTRTQRVSPFEILGEDETFQPNSSRNIIVEDDIIWSNAGSRIIRVDASTGRANSWKEFPVICMERPNDSLLVFGTNGYHLMQFNTRSKEFTKLAMTDSLWIYDIEIRENVLVGGTDKGVLTYNMMSKKVDFYTEENGLQDPFVLMTSYHNDHGYILGTRSGKIISFTPESETFTVLYEDELNAGIATIVFDDRLWWINTFKGVVAYDPILKTTHRYSESDGLSHNEANRYSALKTDNGFFVGTLGGLNFIDPKKLEVKEDMYELVALSVRSYDLTQDKVVNELDRNHLERMGKIVLPAEQRTLEIGFSLSNNLSNNENTYRYRLNDNDWISLNKQQSLRFPNLAAGKYQLEIEALDFSGKKISNALVFSIVSKNFFYKSGWFYMAVLITVVLILLWLLKQSQLRKNLQEQFSHDLMRSQEQERTRIAKELHDSVGQQLTLIKKKAQNTEQSEISNMTHNALEEVRSISRGLFPVVLKQLGLTESIEQLVFDLDEETALFFSSEIDNINNLFDEEATLNVYRFIQECLTNIIKHAEASTVSVSIKKQKTRIIVSVKDNGKGFELSNELKQHSLGLKTMTERIRILKGIISIESKPDEGTLVVAQIPIKDNYEN